jgi:hypothetical protein
MNALRFAVFAVVCVASLPASAQTSRARVRFSVGSGNAPSVHTREGYCSPPICEAPCQADLEAGTTDLGISVGGGPVLMPAHSRFDLHDGMELSVEHDDRSGLRIAGWVTFATLMSGLAVTLGLALAPPESGCCGGGIILIIPAPILAGFALLVGLPLALLNDHVDIREVDTVRF